MDISLQRNTQVPVAPLCGLAALSVTLALSACGGGGSDTTAPLPAPPSACSICAPGTLSGVAASGAALPGAEVTVIDAKGAKAHGVSDANGLYKVDVSSLTAPFIIEVLGFAGGEAVLLHSMATASDVGMNAVNATPLTEMMTAAVLGGMPADKLGDGSADFSRLTPDAIAAAETAIEGRIKPVLTAAGLAEVDLRKTEFKPDGSGIDKALDALKVTPSGTGYVVALVTGGAPIAVSPSKPSEGGAIAAPEPVALEAMSKAFSEVKAMFADYASQFASAIPEAATLNRYFDPAFYHDGLGRDDFIVKVLQEVDPPEQGGFSQQGVRFDALRIERVIDSDTLDVSYRAIFPTGFQPYADRQLVKRVGGKWVFAGDGLAARVRVGLMARLKETPMAKDALIGLSGVTSFIGDWEGQPYTYYQRKIPADGSTIEQWLGREGDDFFGTFGWAGDEWGDAARLTRSKYNGYYATPDSRVANYIVFGVPSHLVASNVAEIVVNGPGLPTEGLALVKPADDTPRRYWVFKGDSANWNAFNGERCLQVANAKHPIAHCAMDWASVDKGSEYIFSLKDAAGNTVATLSDRLRSKPVSESDALARQSELFARYVSDEAHAFSIRNLFDDASGPFLPGKNVTLNWTVPDQPGFRLQWVSLWMETVKLDATGNPVGSTQYEALKPLFDADPSVALPTAATFSPVHPIPPKWGWTTLSGVDAFGNEWQHELSPSNPF